MRRSPACWLLCAAILLISQAAEGRRLAGELVFHAETKQLCQFDPATKEEICDPVKFHPYPTDTVIALKVSEADCTTAYRWQVDQREVSEVAPGFRGLEEVEGMLVGILAPPESKGVVALEGVAIREQSVADLLARMHTLEGVTELGEELRDKKRGLRRALERLQRGERQYVEQLVCRFMDVQDFGCPEPEHDLDDLVRRLEAQRRAITGIVESEAQRARDEARKKTFEEAAQAIHEKVGGRHGAKAAARVVTGLSSEVSGGTSCDRFNEQAREVQALQREVSNLRGEIEKSPDLAGYAARLPEIAASLRSLLDAYGAKLRRTEAAASVALLVLRQANLSSPRRSETFLQQLRRLEETYKQEDVNSGFLQALAQDYAEVALGEPKDDSNERRLEARLEDLKRKIDELRGEELDSEETTRQRRLCETARRDTTDGGGPPLSWRELQDRLDCLVEEVVGEAGIDRRFAARVHKVNHALKEMLKALVQLHEVSRGEWELASVGSWTTNQVVTVAVFEKAGFNRPDLTPLDQIRLPAGALATSTTEAPAEGDGFSEAKSGLFEVHKRYRFNVGIGIAVSRLGERELGVRGMTRLGSDGTPVLDDEGKAILDPVVVETGQDARSLAFPLLVTYYFKPLDVFPGETALWSHWGASLGFGLDKPDENLFLGLSYQPTLGVQLIGGFHYGRRTTLQQGIHVGDVLPDGTTEAPTRREWKAEPFFSVTFDAKVFRRLLKGAS